MSRFPGSIFLSYFFPEFLPFANFGSENFKAVGKCFNLSQLIEYMYLVIIKCCPLQAIEIENTR